MALRVIRKVEFVHFLIAMVLSWHRIAGLICGCTPIWVSRPQPIINCYSVWIFCVLAMFHAEDVSAKFLLIVLFKPLCLQQCQVMNTAKNFSFLSIVYHLFVFPKKLSTLNLLTSFPLTKKKILVILKIVSTSLVYLGSRYTI